MDIFRVVGGARLQGEVTVSGAKNSVLKLMAASLLATGTTTIHRVPDILDVAIMAEVLRRLGCVVERAEDTLQITVPPNPLTVTDYQLVRRMRATVAVLGPLVARYGHAKVALPGGDAIGSRGLDMHISGLEKLGARFHSEHGYLIAQSSGLTGTKIALDFPSVGATENILMASVLAHGTTVIDNVACEPEIVDLINLLIEMGAQVHGAGTTTLIVEGVAQLQPAAHVTVPDRIVAGTWAIAAVMTGGEIVIREARADHLALVLDHLVRTGATVSQLASGDGLQVRMDRRPKSIDIRTLPYPGFPTDLQPMAIALNAVADGSAMVTENIFEGRFMFANELIRLGASIQIDGHHAAVTGTGRLSGAPVEATDIRAGAGLVLAGLCADGITEISQIHHIDRGYPGFEDQLVGLGADVVRESVPEEDLGAVPTGRRR
ncbi:MAG: UDP-N-acetylglucosamine 1-carboxyvinyltransferase [Antricoccus sp.]